MILIKTPVRTNSGNIIAANSIVCIQAIHIQYTHQRDANLHIVQTCEINVLVTLYQNIQSVALKPVQQQINEFPFNINIKPTAGQQHQIDITPGYTEQLILQKIQYGCEKYPGVGPQNAEIL